LGFNAGSAHLKPDGRAIRAIRTPPNVVQPVPTSPRRPRQAKAPCLARSEGAAGALRTTVMQRLLASKKTVGPARSLQSHNSPAHRTSERIRPVSSSESITNSFENPRLAAPPGRDLGVALWITGTHRADSGVAAKTSGSAGRTPVQALDRHGHLGLWNCEADTSRASARCHGDVHRAGGPKARCITNVGEVMPLPTKDRGFPSPAQLICIW
jgi:hypothetical protein